MSATNPPDKRRLVCEIVIALAICGGAYYFLAGGLRAKISSVRDEIARLQQTEAARAGMGTLTDAQVNDLHRTTAERAAELRAKSLPASDEAVMFARISEIAATHSVRVESLNPAQSQTPAGSHAALPPGVQPGTPAAAAAQAAADGPVVAKDTRIGYAMSITGNYADITGFLGSLSNHLGYTIVKSVRITQPDIHAPDMLRASIETEHIALDLSAVTLAHAPDTRQPMPIAPEPASAGATDHE